MRTFKIITNSKHWEDVQRLGQQITQSEWLSPHTLFICVDPVNTSPTSNMLAHKLSVFNKNEVFEEIPVRMPSLIQGQVFDEVEQEYVPFESHLQMVSNRAIYKGSSYMALLSHISPENERWVVRISQKLSSVLPPDQLKIGSLYLHEDVAFKPDFYVEKYKGRLIYEWQNSNNPTFRAVPPRKN